MDDSPEDFVARHIRHNLVRTQREHMEAPRPPIFPIYLIIFIGSYKEPIFQEILLYFAINYRTFLHLHFAL